MNAPRYSLCETTDYEEWDALVEASEQGTIFSQSKFFLAYPAPFRCYKVLSGRKTVALLPLSEDAAGRSVVQVDFAPYAGILFLDQGATRDSTHSRIKEEFRITEFVVEELTRRYAAIALPLSWNFADLRPFLWHNYHRAELGRFATSPRYTALLDLQTLDVAAYPGQTRACRRQELKKAASFQVRECSDAEEFLSLYVETFVRQEIVLPQERVDLVASIVRRAVEFGFGRLASCDAGEGTASMTLFLYDRKRAYYLFAANNPRLRNSGASTRLMFDNIFEAKRRGLRELDFVGTNSPNRGDFKLSFNPRLALYFDLRFPVFPRP